MYLNKNRFKNFTIPDGKVLKSWSFNAEMVYANEVGDLINVPIAKQHGTSRLSMELKDDVDNSVKCARRIIIVSTDPVAIDAYGASLFSIQPEDKNRKNTSTLLIIFKEHLRRWCSIYDLKTFKVYRRCHAWQTRKMVAHTRI